MECPATLMRSTAKNHVDFVSQQESDIAVYFWAIFNSCARAIYFDLLATGNLSPARSATNELLRRLHQCHIDLSYSTSKSTKALVTPLESDVDVGDRPAHPQPLRTSRHDKWRWWRRRRKAVAESTGRKEPWLDYCLWWLFGKGSISKTECEG